MFSESDPPAISECGSPLFHSISDFYLTSFESTNKQGTICVYLTSCSHSHLSRMFRHWMRHCSTMKSLPSGCAPTLPSTPITQHVAGWDSLYLLQFRRLTTGSSCCATMTSLHTVRGASGSGSLEGVTKLVPDTWLIRTCQRTVGEGQT